MVLLGFCLAATQLAATHHYRATLLHTNDPSKQHAHHWASYIKCPALHKKGQEDNKEKWLPTCLPNK